MAETIMFYSIAAVITLSAIMVVASRNVLYSALWLASTLFGVAALFVTLGAWFLAGIQVLIYIGAVVVLAIFVINLTKKVSGGETPQFNKQVIPAGLVSALTLVLIILAVLKTDWATRMAVKGPDTVPVIGRLLLTDFVVPFEVVSVLLLGALIGAIVIVSKEKGDKA